MRKVIAISVVISTRKKELLDQPVHIDIAVDIAHERLEDFRSDWHKENADNSKNNSGIFFEQMSERIAAAE